MKMEVPPSTFSFCDDDRKNLEQLLSVFGSVVSLDDIASAYCRAGRDPNIAGGILWDLQPSTSRASVSASEENLKDSVTPTSESPSEICSERADINPSKPKKFTTSIGTVSSMIASDYLTSRPFTTENSIKVKPLKLNSDDFSSEIWDDKASTVTTAMSETMHSSVEEFLFKMLGDGFSLDMSVIEDVMGQCGYDVNKSMDKLLDMSASALGKSDDIISIGDQKSIGCPAFASNSSQGKRSVLDSTSSSKVNNVAKNGLNLSKREKERYELQKEVLQSLFSVPERYEDQDDVVRPSREIRKSNQLSQFVVKPLKEPIEHQIFTRKLQIDATQNNGGDEETYEALRTAVMEYWIIMKEYYKAAAEAFTEGDHERARNLLEEGHFFMRKARESDERSTQKLLEIRDNKEEVTVDVHVFEPKEAVRFLKIQLTSLSGISSIQYLKIIVGTNDEEAKGPRKRLIMKLLERDSIAWTEEENGRVIVIRVDEINPKKLTFAKRSTVRA